jgi:topoisomerase-4 subunit A
MPPAAARFRLRARWEVEKLSHGQYQIVVTEIPYQVQKARLIERLAELLERPKLPLLEDLRDESTEDVRLVLVPRSRRAMPSADGAAVPGHGPGNPGRAQHERAGREQGAPGDGLRELLEAFLEHRMEVLVRGTRFRLGKIEHRLEVLDGYLIAFLNIDEVIRIIREEDEPKPVIDETD